MLTDFQNSFTALPSCKFERKFYVMPVARGVATGYIGIYTPPPKKKKKKKKISLP